MKRFLSIALTAVMLMAAVPVQVSSEDEVLLTLEPVETAAEIPALAAVPAATPSPTPSPTPAPAQAPVPVYDTGSDAAAYTPVQPEPYTYNSYENDNYQPSAPLPAWTPAPAQPRLRRRRLLRRNSPW